MSKTEGLPTTIGIYGTCVSTDIFLYNHSENKTLSDKIAMRDCTIFGLNTPRPEYVLSEAIKHPSSLHTMWLNTIYDGKVFQFMRDNAGEYLIIDFVDERFSDFKYGESVFLEHFFAESNFFELIKREDCEFETNNKYGWGVETRFSGEEIEQKVKYFCDQILQIYEKEKIIIHEFYLVHQYMKDGEVYTFDGKTINDKIYKSDKLFPLLYAYLKKYLPDCKTIHFEKEYMADVEHPRGLSPTHCSLDYYDDAYKELQHIVEEDYAVQRNIPLSQLSNVDYSNYSKTAKEYKKLGCNTDYLANIFSRLYNYTTFEGKNVLWVGGNDVSHTFIRELKINKFARLMYSTQKTRETEYFEKHSSAFSLTETFIEPKNIFIEHNFAYYWGKIESLTEDFADLFDIIFIDDLEEIHAVEVCLDNIYKCLRKGGVFFAKTGRTWSASYGNKWSIDSSCNYLNSNRIPQYTHLLMDYQEADRFLQKEELSISVEELLQGSHGLNHLFYEDYENLIDSSLFRKKRITPLFQEEIDVETLNTLKEKYPGYQVFDYKSLFVFCEK